MKCFIIDDEPLARKGLKEFIEQTQNLEFIGEANNPMEAIAQLHELSPDLLFLDIQMPKMSGVDFVIQFKPKMPIIYTTAYSKYAVECFDLDVEDYLLKPLSYNRFLRAINRVYSTLEKKHTKISANEQNEGTFFIKSEGEIQKIILDEILYLKSIQNYVKIQLENKSFIVHQTLKSFKSILPSAQFLKVHKSYLVNRNKIDSMKGYLLHLGEVVIPVSRSLTKEVKSLLLNINK